MNGFSRLPGDRFDAVISTSILEHWYHFFTGKASWNELNYFYPYRNTIAQTDAYFLLGVIYTPFRLLGADPFLSAEFAAIAIKALGFFSCFFLAVRYFKFQFRFALLAAILFTMSNGMTAHSSRIQLSTVAFLPVMAILLAEFLKALKQDERLPVLVKGASVAILFAGWCFTCFYMAWFFTYLSVFLFLFTSIIHPSWLREFLYRCKFHIGVLVCVAVVALVALLPFLSVYLPKAAEVGMRSYESVSTFILPIEGVLEVGPNNLALGELYGRIMSVVSPNYKLQHEYSNTGFTLPLFILFVLGAIKFCRKSSDRETIWLPLICATALTWILSLRFFDHSAWFWIYSFFPGAKALNVVAAYQIFIALPVIFVAVRFLQENQMTSGAKLILAALLFLCEINIPYLNLFRHEELARIQVEHTPPPQCKVFFVTPWAGQDKIEGFSEWINNFYPHNVTAIMLAQQSKIPTINGIASFNPKDWDFAAAPIETYETRIKAYAQRHQIKGLCRFDLNSKSWSDVGENN